MRKSDLPARLLVIAGSDNSAGAGLQADLKTAQAFGVYAQTAVTAITVQNTHGVTEVHPVPPDVLAAQIAACLSDIGADAIKIGMLGNAANAAAVANALDGVDLPLVVDPVILSTSGAGLLDEAGIDILKRRLIRKAMIVTPNVPEAEMLCGVRPKSDHSTRNAAMAFNRWLDARWDALNPRTAIREIPAGIISKSNALRFVLFNCLAFIVCTWFINPLCFALSFVALAVVLGYSYTKRFTPLCHLVLGLGLSLAPIGAYLAVTTLVATVVFLPAALLLYGADAGIVGLWAAIGLWMATRMVTLALRARGDRWMVTGAVR